MAVRMVCPRQVISRGRPTFTDSKRAVIGQQRQRARVLRSECPQQWQNQLEKPNKCGRSVAWLSTPPIHSHLLDPLSAPFRRIKRFGEVLRFVHYFAVLKFHYADGMERTTLIGDRVFRNPQFAGPEKPSNVEARWLARVTAAEDLQIPFAVYSFTGLRVIAGNLFVVDFMLEILISSRRSGPMLAQSGFDLFGCRVLPDGRKLKIGMAY